MSAACPCGGLGYPVPEGRDYQHKRQEITGPFAGSRPAAAAMLRGRQLRRPCNPVVQFEFHGSAAVSGEGGRLRLIVTRLSHPMPQPLRRSIGKKGQNKKAAPEGGPVSNFLIRQTNWRNQSSVSCDSRLCCCWSSSGFW